jgi:hypothetical protein
MGTPTGQEITREVDRLTRTTDEKPSIRLQVDGGLRGGELVQLTYFLLDLGQGFQGLLSFLWIRKGST